MSLHNNRYTTGEAGRPQDQQVSRRWFLNRMAWVSSATATGTLLAKIPALASPPGAGVTEEAFATYVRPQALDDLTELTLSETMTLIRNQTLVPADLVSAYVDRIEAYDHIYQAYAARPTRDDLLAQAERIPADGINAPLRGMCFAPKDNFYTADLLTEGGSLVFKGFQPDYDATVVSLVRAAGGVVVGKAQMGNLAAGAPASTAPRFPPRETPGRRTTRTTAPPGLLRGPAPRWRSAWRSWASAPKLEGR